VSSDATSALTPLTLVVGLGNPILGDDGVGWRVADALEAELAADPMLAAALGPVEIDRLSVGGLRLMERLVGYERVVLVDAALDGRQSGTIAVGTLAEVDGRLAGHLDSAHDASLSAALDVGAALGARLPGS
jgi:hydrogenase maturation protease